jgi:hypothetical protein
MAEENIVIKIKADVGISKEVIEAVTKAMEGLGKTATIVSGNVKVTNKNLEDTNKILGQVAKSAGNAGNELGKAGNSVKKSNIQYTNLALVLQDLPFGFRGIQNNLPALIGGMAGVTGGMYLATSAIIALFTAWDMGAFGATKSTNEWRKSLKETNDEIRNTLNYTNSEVSNLKGLVDVMLDLNTTESIRNKALKEAKEAITKVDEAQGKKIKTIGDAIIAINLYSEAIQQQQMQEVIGKKIAEISIGQIEKRNKLAIETAKANKGIHPIDFFMGNTELDNLNSEIIANETLLRQLEDLRKGNTKALLLNPYSDLNRKGGKDTKGPKPKETYLLESLKAQQQAYKDDIYAFRAYGILIINEEERLAVERAKTDGTYLQNKKDIHARYQADRITNDNLFENNLNTILETNAKKRTAIEEKEFKRNQDSIEANMNFETKIYRDSNRVWDQIQKEKSDAQVKYTRDYINKLNEQLRVELKLHKNNVLLQQEDVKNKIDQLKFLQFFAAGNVAATELINSAILKLSGTLAGFGDISAKISTVLGDSLQTAFEGIGETIGQLIATGKFDFSILGNILADALIQIGKALIMYSALVKAAKEALEKGKFKAGLVVGVLAIAAGVALKASLNKKKDSGVQAFANGGVISGPTMGLMGEYPGARSNPEIVAPLDKLKSLIGGSGGGTLEARISGNDLLILMNKAQRNNNLSF